MTPRPPASGRPAISKLEMQLRHGQLDAAAQTLDALSPAPANAADIWLVLASQYGQRGQYRHVADCCRNALKTSPSNANAHSLLGSASVMLNRPDDAIQHLEIASRLAPGNPGIQTNLGNALYAAGKIDQAIARYTAALQIQPGHAQASFGLGNCSLATGRWEDAISHYRTAYLAMSGNYDINMSLGKSYANVGALDEALQCFERARTLTEHPAIALCDIAKTLQLMGRLEQALAYAELSLQSDPDNADARALHADILYKAGRLDDARAQVSLLLDAQAITPHVVETLGNMCHHFDACETVINLAEKLVADDGTSRMDRMSLHYLLGRLHDRAAEYRTAFSHYDQANNIMPDDFDRDGQVKMIDHLIAAYGIDLSAELPRSRCTDERPVFIVGMPRSGTSLVEQILASHAEIFGAGELSRIKELAGEAYRPDPNGLMTQPAQFSVHALDGLAQKYLAVIDSVCGAALRCTDKMPANFLWLGLIMQLFPGARIIHCRRDPRDTCLSIYFQQFSRSHAYATRLDNIAFYYRQYERLMSHWRGALDIRMLEIRYEDLVRDIATHARGMVEFLGLDWDPNCANFHESGRTTATASWDQVRRQAYTGSIARWKHYRDQIAPLLAEFGANDIAAPQPPAAAN